MEKTITPGLDGLPPKKDEYSPDEKILIVAKAAEAGVHNVAEAYGITWQRVSAWKRNFAYTNASDTAGKNNGENRTTAKTKLIIQSPSGMEITPEEIQEKIISAAGTADKAYVRPDEGRAYWVRLNAGQEEHGAVELW